MSSQESKAQAIKDFTEVFPVLTEEFLKEVQTRNFPEEAVQWIKKSFDHNVQGGKMNRGLSVVDTLRILQNDQLTAEELFKSKVLGWCVEWLQAFFLVADDIMDASITRRGNPCWYKMEDVGMIAINDSFILESAIYFFLKKYFRQDSYYIDLLELFHEITLETELGQLLDLTTAPENHVDLSKFSIEKYRFIVLYKTAFYSFYLPVALAMHMAGIKNEKAFKAAKDILLPLGEYFQIQDDYLDSKWFKEWVPQDVVATGGKCSLFKWVTEATLKAMKEKSNEPEAAEPEPEPTTEVLFLCSYEGCGKTFIDAGALRKHSHIHGERQYVCHYEGCGKKFLDSSKLKRHFLIHTGERDFVCPHEGCGKAFSLDFNLRSHMKTHSQENYHICPYPDCGKRYAHEYKLKNHIASHHEKNNNVDVTKYAQVQQPPEKVSKTSKPSASAYGSASSDRPYCCPYEGCDKAYIHEYKLNLHLRREHPGHLSDENTKNTQSAIDNDMDEGSDQDAYAGKRGNSSKMQKQSKPKPNLKLPPSKVARKGSTASPANLNLVKKAWPVKEEVYEEEEDSEETEEDRDNVEDGWRYAENNEDDDEETEYED